VSRVPFGRTLYPLGLLVWLAAFGWLAAGISRAGERLWRASDRLEGEAAALDAGSLRLQDLSRRSASQARDARFLESLPDVLPEDKGYLRTQKAIAEEVARLRVKVGRRLRGALQVVVDAKANKLYVKKGLKLLWQADVSVGRGGLLTDRKSGQRWVFATPRGVFRVIGKGRDPKWRKPDWAFVEDGEPVPPPDDPSRFVSGELGAYFLNLGDGYLIHGTRDEKTLGRPASHGCVRVGAADLERLFKAVPVGTKVYIFE
jgi:L,D-transpeptidase YbiS